jgi:hypothetical protein
LCCLLSQGLAHEQDKVYAPRVMMTFTAAPAEPRLTQFLAWPIIGAHDMRQFVQACLFAFTDIVSVVRADLDPMLKSVSAASPLPANHGYEVGVCRERSLEPVQLLDGMDVICAMPMIYRVIILDQH